MFFRNFKFLWQNEVVFIPTLKIPVWVCKENLSINKLKADKSLP